MSDTSTIESTIPDREAKSRAFLTWAAAAAVVIVAAAGFTLALTGRDTPSPAPPDDIANGPISPGGDSMALCVETYDLETLGRRQIAFDGTVQEIEGDEVTFTVNEWYRGGTESEVTLGGAAGLSGFTSAGSAAGLEPGARMLVAGDGGFAWACGFTQPYDPDVAENWKTVFGV